MKNCLEAEVLCFGAGAMSNLPGLEKIQGPPFTLRCCHTLKDWVQQSRTFLPDVVMISPSVVDIKEIERICAYSKENALKSIPVILIAKSSTLSKLPINLLQKLSDVFVDEFYSIDYQDVIYSCMECDEKGVIWESCFQTLLDNLNKAAFLVHRTGRIIATSKDYDDYIHDMNNALRTEFRHAVKDHLPIVLENLKRYHRNELLEHRLTEDIYVDLQTMSNLSGYFICILRSSKPVNEFQHPLANSFAGGNADFNTRFGISKREQEVLKLICWGRSSAEIADELFISIRTVEKHRASILHKTKARNMAEVVAQRVRTRVELV